MHYGSGGARKGHPMAIVVIVVIFLVFILWMGSSVAPGGTSHTHLVGCGGDSLPCGSGNATAGEVPVGGDPTQFYDIPGGSTDNFNSFYNNFILLGSGLLVAIGLMAGMVVWMFRGKSHV